jgi:galactokinase
MSIPASIEGKFRTLFREEPVLVRSPGRVNLIGEHTDYNEGFVLPAAIDKAIFFAISARSDRHCHVTASDLGETFKFSLDALQPSPQHWPNYLMGVVDQFVKRGCPIGGFNCVFGGDIPIGAGLSSSAALEAGLAVALNIIFEAGIDNLSLVKLAQRAENEFVGVRCGIMDQYVNIFGRRDRVLRIDCRSLEHTTYSFEYPVDIVLFDTGRSHSLASSEYNRRREECSEGVAAIRKRHPSVTHLRDVTPAMLAEARSDMSATTYRRCAYVVGEIERLLRGCRALERNDLDEFGQCMFETHDGLSRDYEVSCPELDHLVDLVRNMDGVYGARMMGAGFGGCTINLVRREATAEISGFVQEQYRRKFGNSPKRYVTSVASGTEILSTHEAARS